MRKLSILASLLIVYLIRAISAFGAAGPVLDKVYPALAHDAQNNQYLVVYEKDIYINGQFLDADGMPTSVEFAISDPDINQRRAAVAYDGVNGRFLVVWSRTSATSGIYGQFVNAAGGLIGGNFVICSYQSVDSPKVAYDSINKRFLAVWEDNRNSTGSNADIYGQLINADGSLIGGNLGISTATDHQFQPSVAFDSVNQQYFAVWMDSRISGYDIYGRLLDAGGTSVGSDLIVSNAAGMQTWPSVVYDGTHRQYFVVWSDDRNLSSTGNDIVGQLTTAEGLMSGGSFTISAAAGDQSYPAAAFDSVNNTFIVAWQDNRSGSVSGSDIYGQLIDTGGGLAGTNFSITAATGDQQYPATAYNSISGNFLVASENWNVAPTDLSYVVVSGSAQKSLNAGGGGGCFIATAAYGSSMDDEVKTLREFRDTYLLTNAPGRAFVKLYYQYSPAATEYIAQDKSLRTAVRVALAPAVFSVKHPFVVLVLLAALAAVFVKRYRIAVWVGKRSHYFLM